MSTNNKMIPIPGRLHSVTEDGIVGGANEIFDDDIGKFQGEINQEIKDEISNIKEGDTGSIKSLQSQITQEISDRENSDNVLSNNIASESDRAEAAEGALSSNIASEKTRAEAAEQTLRENITAEETRAKAAEQAL